jgi:DNA-binding NtrC family response regulator
VNLTQIGAEPGKQLAIRSSEASDRGTPQAEAAQQRNWALGPMVGRSLAMQHLFARMKCTARYFRVASVEGESGTGKMLAAETLHRIGPAAAGPFAPCSAVTFLENPDALWKENRHGLLYLAGVDDLSLEMQRQLREFLASAAHERIRTRAASGPLQLVAGSSKPLRRLVGSGLFRCDLASHLTAIRFFLPPLRERREDIALLAELFLERWSEKHEKPLRGFVPGTLERLAGYPWPGNVRELESTISAAALECAGQWVRPIDIPRLEWSAPGPAAGPGDPSIEDANLDRAILRHITRVLARAGGNKVRAARMLGISRSTLYRLLDPGDGRTVAAGEP